MAKNFEDMTEAELRGHVEATQADRLKRQEGRRSSKASKGDVGIPKVPKPKKAPMTIDDDAEEI